MKKRREKIFLELIDILRGYEVKVIAENANVSPATVYFWLDGTTRTPRLDTFVRVAESVGYRVDMTLTKAMHLKVVG